MIRVLIVDDHRNVRRSMALVLEHHGMAVREAASAAEALAVLGDGQTDVVVTDVRLDRDTDGAALLRAIKERDPDIEVILITAFGTIDQAVEAIKSGAYEYLTKPVDPARLAITVRRAAERRALSSEVRLLRAEIGNEEEIIARSHAMQSVVREAVRLAQSESTVLVTGESGTGKELIARLLYLRGPRRKGKFVPINCGALPETILESELFGYQKGAFTGAGADRKGLLEEAHGGVLFLDELGEIPHAMQVRLLRFLQDGEVRPVGGTETRRVDVRLVAATHRSPDEEVAAGRLRQDFYYRINVIQLRIPPLRERPEDVEALAEHFLHRLSARLRRRVVGFDAEAKQLLREFSWPGNVRELQNAIERAVNLSSGELITVDDLPAALSLVGRRRGPIQARELTRPAERDPSDERQRLLEALEAEHWSRAHAASRLGISRSTLWRKLREHQIDV
jgi:DNA-binding NtrC family response regulator